MNLFYGIIIGILIGFLVSFTLSRDNFRNNLSLVKGILWKRRTIWIFMGIISLSIFILVYIFFNKHWSNQFSNDVHVWASTGAYFDGIIGTLISFITLLLTAYIAIGVRELDIRSNSPYGVIECFDKENYISVDIANHGKGPLVMLKLKFQIQENNGYREINRLISLFEEPHFGSIVWENFFYTNSENVKNNIVIKDGERLNLLRLQRRTREKKETFGRKLNKVRPELARVVISFKYTDVFGETIKEKSSALDIFSRHKNLLKKSMI